MCISLLQLPVLSVTAGEGLESGQWVKRSSLVDSRTSVQDVKFAPRHLGLQLVSQLFSQYSRIIHQMV